MGRSIWKFSSKRFRYNKQGGHPTAQTPCRVVYCVLCTLLFTEYSVHYCLLSTVRTLLFTEYSVHYCLLSTVYTIVYCVQCTLLFTEYSVHYCLLCTLYTIVYCVLSTVYTLVYLGHVLKEKTHWSPHCADAKQLHCSRRTNNQPINNKLINYNNFDGFLDEGGANLY